MIGDFSVRLVRIFEAKLHGFKALTIARKQNKSVLRLGTDVGWLVLIVLRKRATGGQKCAAKKERYEILKLVSDLRVWIKTVSFGNSILVWFQATNSWNARKFNQQFFWDFVKRRLYSIFHSQLFCVLLYIDGLSNRPGMFQLCCVNCSLYIVKNFLCWTGLIYLL